MVGESCRQPKSPFLWPPRQRPTLQIRNVIGHLPEEHHGHVRQKLHCAYAMREYADARRGLDLLHRELMDLNPSAARSLEEGMEETLAIHRLRVPPMLRTSFASTNLIESTFSVVETVCRNVKRWKGGDQHLRWVGSGLLYAESRWNRVHGYRELPVLVQELELAVLKRIPLRHATVGIIGVKPSRPFQLKSGHPLSCIRISEIISSMF